MHGDDVALQTRCIHCLAEQPAPNVIAFSYGETDCHRCLRKTRLMTRQEYMDALFAAWELPPLRPPRQRSPHD